MALRNEYFKYFSPYHPSRAVAEYTEKNESSGLDFSAPCNFTITRLTFSFLRVITRTTDHLPATGVITGKATESCGINKCN